MGQYTIKDIQDQAELLEADVQRIYRSIYTKLGFFPKSLDQVPYHIIQQLYPSPTKEPLSITPARVEQKFAAPENVKFDPITVDPVTSDIDINIQPENIKEGINILGVDGILKEEKTEEVFDVQPTTVEQTITPAEGNVFSGGTVHAVTSSIDSNIQPENIKEGVSILGVEGTLSGGGGSDVFVVPDGVKFGFSTVTEIPSNWDFSNVTNMDRMFYLCRGLTTIPLLDTSNVTNMSYMFNYCEKLTTIPQLDTSKVTNMNSMFGDCRHLTTIPQLDTSKVTDMRNMLDSCNGLTTVEGIDFSGLTSELTKLFGSAITTKPNITRFIVNGKINVSISDGYSINELTAIDYDSVKSILEAANRTDNTNAKKLAFYRTMTDQNGELAALVSSCTSKGWTITGLTLQ